VIRTDNLLERPWTAIFHAGGTAEYSSATNVGAPFIGRAGGFGQWEKVGTSAYSMKVREHMYVADPAAGLALKAGGAWYVDAVFHHDDATDSLCSGPASTGCPETNKIKLVKYEFDAAGDITSETSLNAGTAWIGDCQRLEAVFPVLHGRAAIPLVSISGTYAPARSLQERQKGGWPTPQPVQRHQKSSTS
jgi:hypothetical protein